MSQSLSPTGVLELKDWLSLLLTGSDIFDFLHRLSTLDFRSPQPSVRLGALLSGRAQLVSGGFFESTADGVVYTLPNALVSETLTHLERFHFSEAVTFSLDTSSTIWVADRQSAEVLRPLATRSWELRELPNVVWFRVRQDREWNRQISSLASMSRSELHAYFLENGSAILDLEKIRNALILEVNLENAVDRNKGCYPGQEVVERIFSYGNANRKLLPVEMKKDPENLPCTLRCDGKEAGLLVAYEAHGGLFRGLALVHRNYWDKKHLKGDPDLVATIL